MSRKRSGKKTFNATSKKDGSPSFSHMYRGETAKLIAAGEKILADKRQQKPK